MATTGKIYAGTVGESSTGNSWTNITNAQGNTPTTHADCALNAYDFTKILSATNFDFSSIPGGSTINGITVYITVEGVGSGDLNLGHVQLIVSGTPTGDNKGGMGAYVTTKQERSFGSSSDLWAAGHTLGSLQDSSSGVKIIMWEDGTDTITAEMYSIAIDVDYTAGGGGGGGASVSQTAGFFALAA